MATARGIIAGKAFVVLEAIDNTPRVLARIRANFMRFAGSLQAMGASMITAGLKAAAPSAISMKIFSDFDDAMRRVEARSSGTAQELTKVREQAMLLGRTTSFTARMIANLQSILAQRGFGRSQILEMTPHVMNLARAAGTGNRGQDVLTSADLVTGALRAFKIDAKRSATVADIFTAAVNNSNFSLEDLIISMGNAGPIANRFQTGLTGLAETVAVMAAMRNVNVDPSIAGTGFRNLMLKASDPKRRKEFNAELQKTSNNFIEFVSSAENLHRIPSILFSIEQAMEGMGTAQKGYLLANLFGLRAIVPAGALAGAEENFNFVMKQIQMAGNLSKKTAALMDAGIGGSFRILVSAAEGLALALGDTLAPAMQTVNQWSTQLQTSIAEWTSNNKQLVASINLSIAPFMALGVGLFALGLAFKVLAFSLAPVQWALSLLLIPFRLLLSLSPIMIGVLAGVAAAVYVFAGSFMAAWKSIAEFVANMGTAIASVWSGVVDALSAGQLELATAIALEGMKLIWIKFKNYILLLWQDMNNKMISMLYKTLDAIQSILPASMEVMMGTPPQYFGQQARGMMEERQQQAVVNALKGMTGPRLDKAEQARRMITGPLEGLEKIMEVVLGTENLVRPGAGLGLRTGVPQKGLEEKTGEAITAFYKNLIRIEQKGKDIDSKQLDVLEQIEVNTGDLNISTTGTGIIGV